MRQYSGGVKDGQGVPSRWNRSCLDYDLEKFTEEERYISGSLNEGPTSGFDKSNILSYPSVGITPDGEIYAVYFGQLDGDPVAPINVARNNSQQVTSISPVSPLRSLSLGPSADILVSSNTIYHTPPEYVLSKITPTDFIPEGGSVVFEIDTKNLSDNSSVDYTITGVQAADIVEPLTGSFTVFNNKASLVINVVEDLLTEGNQNLTLTLDDDPSQSETITIQDTSTTP